MKTTLPMVNLGFSEERFPAGVHICQIFSDDTEREDSLLKFILSGLQEGECTCSFSDKTAEPAVSDFLGRHGVSCAKVRSSGALTLAGTREVYFRDGRFDPERMLQTLTQSHEDSGRQGYPAARVIGEMVPEVKKMPGGGRLLEYESKVSLLLRDHPVTTVCQYDARAFDGTTILNILNVHPMMVIRGSVVHNPFFVPPEEFLAR